MVQQLVRRAEFMLVLAYASDLATGQTRDFALRSSVLAMRLARAAGLSETEFRNVYHLALLRYIGCNADTHLLTALFGDEYELRRDVALNLGDPAERPGVLRRAITRAHIAAGTADVAAAVETDMASAPQVTRSILAGHCEVARRIGQRLGLSPDIQSNLGQLYERWDGKGMPFGINGNAVRLAVRLVTLAQDAIIHAEASGIDGMVKVITRRRDGAYEAELADVFLARPNDFLDGLAGESSHAAILSMEPQPHASLTTDECEDAYLAIADMIDMRMPYTMGHSRAVADLVDRAARHMKLPERDICTLRHAAYVHDIGELAIPVARWQRSKPFLGREIDEMQLHPYHGERALAALTGQNGEVAALVLRHHERINASGYHRKVTGNDLSPAARLLAVAEAYRSACEARPHRAPVTEANAAGRLREAVRAGELCPAATAAVLAVAGQGSRRDKSERLAGLSAREIEVLRLIISGLTAKAAAEQLDIAPKTAENHIQNLYSKIGVTTRAGAALFAVENGLAN